MRFHNGISFIILSLLHSIFNIVNLHYKFFIVLSIFVSNKLYHTLYQKNHISIKKNFFFLTFTIAMTYLIFKHLNIMKL